MLDTLSTLNSLTTKPLSLFVLEKEVHINLFITKSMALKSNVKRLKTLCILKRIVMKSTSLLFLTLREEDKCNTPFRGFGSHFVSWANLHVKGNGQWTFLFNLL